MDEKNLSHSPWDCKYHIVFGVKFQRKDKSGYRENPQEVV